MSLTDAQFIAWCKSGEKAFRCLLVETKCKSGGVEITRYLSSVGFTADPTDAAANRKYLGVITGGGVTSETLSITGNGSFAVSSIELSNTNGELDAYLLDIWEGRSTKMYVGDMRWPTTDFRLVFDGINEGLLPGSDARGSLALSFRDKLQRFDCPASDTKLGGASVNADRLIPWALGELHNVTPLLEDYATLKYRWNSGAMESVIEIRDNGVPVNHTNTLTTGKSTLNQRPFGLVTGSIQGAKFGGTYLNTIALLVQALALNFGQDPFVSGDIDAANITAFNTAHPQPVGRWLSDTENLYSIMQEFAQSVGAQVICNAAGLLQLMTIAVPTSGASTLVTDGRMRMDSLHIVDRPPVIAASMIGYVKNWTVQTQLDTGIPVAHKDMYKQEWYTTTASNPTTAADYKITKAPEQRNTLLLKKTDADTEAARELALWGVQRTVFGYDGEPELMLEPLGGAQTLKTARFNLSGGVYAQIIEVERDWINMTVKFKVLA